MRILDHATPIVNTATVMHDLRMGKRAFGQMIRQGRELKGYTSIDLAVRLRIQQSTVSRLENGKFTETPPPDMLSALAGALDLDQERMLRTLGYLAGTREEHAIAEGPPAYDLVMSAAHDLVDQSTLTTDDLLPLRLVLAGLSAENVRKRREREELARGASRAGR